MIEKILKFEVEIPESALKEFWNKLQLVEMTKGTIEEAEPFKIEEAFKDFFYQDFGMYDNLDLRDQVKVTLKK